MVKGEDVNDNPPNRGDTVFMCGMILFRVDVGIGKDHATVKNRNCRYRQKLLPLLVLPTGFFADNVVYCP